jgi:hypothetical protein
MNDQISFDLPGQVKRKEHMTQLANRTEPTPLATIPAPTHADTIMQAIAGLHQQGASIEAIERLTALYERITTKQAEERFTQAYAKFQSLCPQIPRRSTNSFFKKVDRRGVQVDSKYASLEDIGRAIQSALAAAGITYRWSDMKVNGDSISLTCIVSHGTHSTHTPITLPVDTKQGGNGAQKAASLLTYAQRYSLIQALGLTTCDEDDDGVSANADVDTITESQAADLDTAIENVKGNKVAFCRRFNIGRLSELPASKLGEALAMVEAKRREAMK